MTQESFRFRSLGPGSLVSRLRRQHRHLIPSSLPSERGHLYITFYIDFQISVRVGHAMSTEESLQLQGLHPCKDPSFQ